MTVPWVLPLLLALLICAAPGAASADAKAEARAQFNTARGLFEKGKYDEAIKALKRAYALKPLSVLLRYTGDCHRKLGQREQALEHYVRYLRKLPDAPDAASIKRRIKLLRAQVRREMEREYSGKEVPRHLQATGKDQEDPLTRRRQVALAPAQVEPRSESGALTVAKWVTAGVGVAALAMGITFNRLAAGAADDFRDKVMSECPGGALGCTGNPGLNKPIVSYSMEHYHMQEDVQRYNTMAVTSLVIGGAVAATSVVLFILDRPSRRRQARAGQRKVTVAPMVGQTLGIAGEVRF